VGGLSEFLATVPDLAWAALVLGIGIPVIMAVFPHGRFRFHHWRLHRRLLAQPVIFAEELREYEQAAGDEPGPIEWLPLIGGGILHGGLTACIILLQHNGFDRWVAIGTGLLFLAAMVLALWRKVNDPPEQAVAHDEPGYQPSYAVPPEALQGFGLAVMVLIGVLSLVLALRA
jgi:hypothetical protein